MQVKDKKTGQIFRAEYAANILGNMRMWVNGKFYSDKEFSKLFTPVKQ